MPRSIQTNFVDRQYRHRSSIGVNCFRDVEDPSVTQRPKLQIDLPTMWKQLQFRRFAMSSILLSAVLPSLASGFLRGSLSPTSKGRLGTAMPRNVTCPPKYSLFNVELFPFVEEEEQGPGAHCSPILNLLGHRPANLHGVSCENHDDVGRDICLHRDCRYELRLDKLTNTSNNDVATSNCSFDSVVKIKLDKNVVWQTVLQSEGPDVVLIFSVGSNQTTLETSAIVGRQHNHRDAHQSMIARRFLQVRSLRCQSFLPWKLKL